MTAWLLGGAMGVLCAPMAQANPAAETAKAASIEEVVVTARQRAESLQDAPLSIAAVTEATLRAQGITTLVDLDAKVPGLTFGSRSGRLQTFSGARGVGDYTRNAGYDNRLGIYLDGVLMGRSAATDYPIFEISQVEVLRGPQGTLFGKDVMTGAVNVTSSKPAFEPGSSAKLAYGSRDLISGSGMLNATLSDKLAVRLSVAGKSETGYYTNLYDGKHLGGGTNFGGRVQVRYVPDDATTFDVSADAVRDESGFLIAGNALAGPGVSPKLGKHEINYNNTPEQKRFIYGAGLNIQHAFANHFALSSITGFRGSEGDLLNNDFDLSPQFWAVSSLHDKVGAFSQEFRLASPTGKAFEFVAGSFYYYQKPKSHWTVLGGPDAPIASIRTVNGVNLSEVPSHTAALFGHGTWHAADWLTFDAGVRYNYVHKSIRFSQIGLAGAGNPDVPNYRDKLSEHSIDPTVSVTVTPVSDVHFYAVYSTGHRPGGWNADFVKSANLRFNAEKVENYEVGAKSEFFDRRLRLNATLYQMKFTDFQVTQSLFSSAGTIIPTLTNAGKVTSSGAEIDFEAAPFRGFKLVGGVGLNRAEYDSFKNGGGVGVNYDGNRLIEAPRFTGSLTSTYEWPINADLDGQVSFNYTYKSHTFLDASNLAVYKQDPRGLVNARVSVSHANTGVEVTLFARNLTDQSYVLAAGRSGFGFGNHVFGEPRTVGVELSIRR